LDILYGDYTKMYSYQGWDTLTTSSTKQTGSQYNISVRGDFYWEEEE